MIDVLTIRVVLDSANGIVASQSATDGEGKYCAGAVARAAVARSRHVEVRNSAVPVLDPKAPSLVISGGGCPGGYPELLELER